jgi:hypothetical protein
MSRLVYKTLRTLIANSLSFGKGQAKAVGLARKHGDTAADDYFFIPRIESFAALATRNLTTVLAGILIFCCVLGLKPVRAFLFCFTSLPKPGRTNSPLFLISLLCECAERLEEYSSGSFVGLGGSSECDLKLSLGHV